MKVYLTSDDVELNRAFLQDECGPRKVVFVAGENQYHLAYAILLSLKKRGFLEDSQVLEKLKNLAGIDLLGIDDDPDPKDIN